MDPYDALIEQLRSAREQRQQALNERLKGALDSLATATTAVRDALSTPAEEAFPLDQVESSMAVLRDAALEAAAIPPPAVNLAVLRSLDAAHTQSELLHGLLSELTNHAARAVVLVFRPGGVSAWSAIGFDDVSRLGRWSCAREDSPLFAGLEDHPGPLQVVPQEDPVIRGWLEGETPPIEALLVPICLRGRTMGAVYADRLATAPWNPEAIQVLVAVACWMIDTLKHRTAAPSPMLAEIAGARREPAPAPEEAIAEAVAPPAAAALDQMAAAPGFDPSATVRVGEAARAEQPAVEPPEYEVEVEPTLEPAPELPAAPPGAGAGTVEFEVVEPEPELPPPVQPVVPPPDLRRDWTGFAGETPGSLSPEDQSKHEEARRFARLLVSEIKLYNEEAVELGREQRDLYQRLRDDIDRSREMYEKRIPADIRAARDHFREELVRILAGGDAGALGA
ncbi:MAG TPA: hypothetical protein PKJ99_06245 [Thermoanaerobaculales bacterium]|nr:hypothetical protein [Thermoanaerobaculales bacterium]HPA80371.1 hypothetical protein [Thermoanaerobaculales bacterium]HQL30011.1 hypothetical protein [Thermoanaerobaculales bacterium]HQN96702.1 hypothetical protein [Thermoanaerobaculales bacterium]HQP93638.1 hypothetical protein [Thermoanaerobaculia bacterium]